MVTQWGGRKNAVRKLRFVAASGAVGLAVLAGTGTVALAGPEGSDGATMCVANTQLRPENEVRAPGVDPVDSTAKGHAQIKVRNDGTIEWKVFILNQDGETFVAGHIHGTAPAGSNAGVKQGLFGGPPTSESHFRDSGSVSNPMLGAAICADPDQYYVNYHTTQDPQGAVRGQLG
jgi:hypothetical protein